MNYLLSILDVAAGAVLIGFGAWGITRDDVTELGPGFAPSIVGIILGLAAIISGVKLWP